MDRLAIAKVYQRLRYIEADHIVFHPDTMKEVPATAAEIKKLMQELASADNK
ncbi:hypothetical protein [Xanthomonas oryzae]